MPSLSFPIVVGSSVKTIVKTVTDRVSSHHHHHHQHQADHSSDEGEDTVDDTYAKGQARHEFKYDIGFTLIKNFIEQSTHHTVEELQDFVTHSVPSPPWIKRIKVTIPSKACLKAADLLIQSDPGLIKSVGGSTWWQWTKNDHGIHAEWIAPKSIWKGFINGQVEDEEPEIPTLFFIHGGGFFFGSLDTHRYQIWRMARKANARAFTVAYRLAPQYPFPCALMDCLAAYLYLTEPNLSENALHKPISPKQIIISGDSAGGNLTLSLLCVLRSLGKELPSGGVLISPWVDLTHSFESVMENGDKDILPPNGFLYQPSEAWPPLPQPSKTMATETLTPNGDLASDSGTIEAQGSNGGGSNSLVPDDTLDGKGSSHESKYLERNASVRGAMGHQVQLYATNLQGSLNNPLVSPMYQTSLGGLCPLLIIASDHECLRDEVIYMAHRAAKPEQYRLSSRLKERNEIDGHEVNLDWKPTLVHLQVYDSTCHMFSVMGWTQPAKYCYRSMGSFCRFVIDLQKEKGSKLIVNEEIVNDKIRNGQAHDPDSSFTGSYLGDKPFKRPEFQSNMVRERIDVEGNSRPLEGEEELRCLKNTERLEGYVPAEVIERFLEGKRQEPKPKRKSKIIEKVNELKMKKEKEKEVELEGFVKELMKAEEVPPSTAMAGRIHTKEGYRLALEVRKQIASGLVFVKPR
ncbi:arylacetamide deacetylase [Melampsora americana]|nr:arylacetamide deacetylase [Melampsora americana]